MGPRHESEDRLQAILQEAYHARGTDEIAEVEPQALMRRIRRAAEPKPAALPGMVLERLFWRLAPAAGALIVILAMVAVTYDFSPDPTLWSLWTYETEATEIAQTMLY